MVVSEGARHALYRRLDEVLGVEHSETLMSHLPPVGWSEVATKREVDALRAEMRLGFENLEHRLSAKLDRALRAQAWRFVFGMIATAATVGGTTLAAAKL
jgi:hypothetical protein